MTLVRTRKCLSRSYILGNGVGVWGAGGGGGGGGGGYTMVGGASQVERRGGGRKGFSHPEGGAQTVLRYFALKF